MSSMKEKLHTGELYLPGDDEIVEDQTKRLDRLYDYNMTRPTEGKKREEMLKVKELKCEHLKNPAGIGKRNPIFSWILESDRRNTFQAACQVTGCEENAQTWDCGGMERDCSSAW